MKTERIEIVSIARTDHNNLIQLLDIYKDVLDVVDIILKEKPMLGAKMAGSTTLGNQRVELRATIERIASHS